MSNTQNLLPNGCNKNRSCTRVLLLRDLVRTVLAVNRIIWCTHLEEIVFEEISHGFVSGNVPPGVEVNIQDEEPGDQDQSRQLRLVADRNQDHQCAANQVLKFSQQLGSALKIILFDNHTFM